MQDQDALLKLSMKTMWQLQEDIASRKRAGLYGGADNILEPNQQWASLALRLAFAFMLNDLSRAQMSLMSLNAIWTAKQPFTALRTE